MFRPTAKTAPGFHCVSAVARTTCKPVACILITSNLPFDEWTETFGTERLTGALLDRLTHRVNILEMNGESYRLSKAALATKTPRKNPAIC
jgi:hypothetical protein